MSTYLDVYSQIKSLEPVFRVPIPSATIQVGTLDAATGAFTGLVSDTQTDPEPVAHGPHDRPTSPAPHYQGEFWVSVTVDSNWRRTTTVIPAPKVGAAPVVLRFDVANSGGSPLVVRIGGRSVRSQPGESFVLYNIWDTTVLSWTASCGTATHDDRLRIQRDPTPLVGVGAFTIPALPISVVYAPPSDAAELSRTVYSQSHSVGTTSRLAITSDSSTTRPWLPTDLESLNTFKTVLSGLSTALGQVNNVYAQAIGSACGVIASGIGTMSGSQTSGTVDAYESAVTVTVATGESIYAEAANGGPGQGDVVHYLRDAKVGWVISGGALRLCLLGGIKASYPATYLQQHAADTGLTHLPASVTQQLLDLDPFVAGWPGMTLPTPRFTDVSAAVYGGPLEFGGGQTVTGSYTQTFTTSTSRVTTTYASQMQDFNAGWLAKICGSAAQTLRTQVSTSRAAGTTQTDTQTYSWELHSGPDEHFIVEFWLDQVFGTLAMRQQLPELAVPRFADVLRDRHGRGLPHHLVTLTVGGRTYSTFTDDEGRYAFHAPGIPEGPGTVTIAGRPPRSVRVARGALGPPAVRPR